ncbi:hypothetical protein [Selenomonas sp.]|uniref:hypothetical protein n=1 Tax=Selenomonas sp. TaxID=2053611 RepID=UPI0025D6B097|nr:hypothetical protein [Selenomonas sp.]
MKGQNRTVSVKQIEPAVLALPLVKGHFAHISAERSGKNFVFLLFIARQNDAAPRFFQKKFFSRPPKRHPAVLSRVKGAEKKKFLPLPPKSTGTVLI